MRNWLIILAVVLLRAFSQNCLAVVGNVGKGTVPPSSVGSSRARTGLIRSPNPLDNSGNRVITGNVVGGKHFQGIVPYQSSSEFTAELGSSSLDSFLRRSYSPLGTSRYPGTYRPYFSRSKTVAFTRPGVADVIKPTSPVLDSRTVYGSTKPLAPLTRPLSARETVIYNRDYRPMSMRAQELAKAISSDIYKQSHGQKLADQRMQDKLKKFGYELKTASDRAEQLRRKLTGEDEDSLLSTGQKWGTEALQPFELPAPAEQAGEDKQLDIYEQMKLQIEKLQKDLEQLGIARKSKEAADSEQEQEGEISQAEKIAEVGRSAAKAKDILGEHKSFASFSEDKFNQHLRAGEEYLKQGKYYRAADAYTLASIYKPDDPLAYAGKSHALFVTGEYMSSALFLSRALEIFPEYARFKIDLEAMVGDKDKLESRIADVEELLGIRNVPELRFLLAYIYHQMGRPDWAKASIDAAYEKMPDSKAVIELKKAIEEFIASRSY